MLDKFLTLSRVIVQIGKRIFIRTRVTIASMNITFLGGGNEIGASCAVAEIGAGRVLVDCGIRMTGDDPLPDLAAIKNSTNLSHLRAGLHLAADRSAPAGSHSSIGEKGWPASARQA